MLNRKGNKNSRQIVQEISHFNYKASKKKEQKTENEGEEIDNKIIQEKCPGKENMSVQTKKAHKVPKTVAEDRFSPWHIQYEISVYQSKRVDLKASREKTKTSYIQKIKNRNSSGMFNSKLEGRDNEAVPSKF